MSGRSSQNCLETRRFEFSMPGKVVAGKPIEAVEDVDVIEVISSFHFYLSVPIFWKCPNHPRLFNLNRVPFEFFRNFIL